MSAGDDIDDVPGWDDDDDGPPIPGWDNDPPPKTAEARRKPPKTAETGNPAIRVPPHSLEAEQAVIGGITLENSQFNAVDRIISPRDFYGVQHRIIMEAIVQLAHAGQPFDMVTISGRLQETNRLDKAGGNAYLAEIIDATPGATNTVAYAEVVAKRSQLRRIINRAGEVTKQAFDQNEDDLEEALAALQVTRVKSGETIIMNSADELRAQGAPIPWIWPGWLPESMFTFLAGEKAMGKSTLAMAVAAHLTNGTTPWSDRVGKKRSVMYWSGEDDVRIIVGRGEAAGLDFSRFTLVMGIREGNRERPFEPSIDMPVLLERIKDDPPDVLIIDPLIRVLKGKNSSAEDVRRSLDPIAAEAERLGIAILGIGHFAKRSGDLKILDRFLGSQAWTARARMTWAIVKAGAEFLFGKPGTNITTERGVMNLGIVEKVVKFVNGQTDKYTYTTFGEVNVEETLDEVERRLIHEHEAEQRQTKAAEKYGPDIEAATAWMWEPPNEGYCTSAEWDSYCAMQGWSTKSGQSKGRKIAAMMGLKMTRRGRTGAQVTYWHLPGVDIK